MHYKPHILQKRVKPQIINDEFGRPIPPTETDTWIDVCKCRCDHNSTDKITLQNGTVIVPKYSVVCDGLRPAIDVDDYARCVEVDGSVRGEGKVCNFQTLNYLPYAKVYLQI